ncbi:molecular chaperone HtpG [Limnoglobus roseus]|uniref:Chaperone protein HtpG n=1 Tax=Limnoglobus roseus TaxID=2598579 RepID=A0A5C1AGC6_9BACT|nr:molecular chaperone HtpG [Limnoglobus roseus]QEL16164.1 molecular chaperone HtpG [Limnoglobus roseus]
MSAETLEFKAELKQLLHLITHSLYSDREIFLRELVSNASDAIAKVQYDSVNKEDQLEGNRDWKIKITPNAEAKTLTISDNGIGMSRDEAIDHLGTIAKSGTKAFLKAIQQKQQGDTPGLIGQFGVGFYSAYMVADTVTVHTRPTGGSQLGVKWASDGQGQFTVEDAPKETRGTDVILHLKEDAQEFLDPYRLKGLIRKFSDFVEHPIVMDETEEKDGTKTTTEVTVNNRRAVWLRSKNEVKPEEYEEFYKQISHDHEPPAKVLHFAVEGKTEFKALAFIPAHRPFNMDWEEQKGGLRLYAQRVLIMDRCEDVLPSYLRFVTGVVDAADLPLNVSRELLQQNPLLETIKKNVTKQVLSGLEALKNTEYEKYVAFYQGLGPVLKEGLARDWTNKDKVADLLLFESMNTEAGKYTTLADYVEKMPEGQPQIFFLTGETTAQLRNSPYLESFRAKGYDVLLLTDPVDEFAIPQYGAYKGKSLQAADRGDVKETGGDIPQETTDQFANLLNAVKMKLSDVADVKLTTRLTDSAACLVASAGGMNANMERLMRKFGQAVEENKRVLELNPANPAVTALRDLHAANPDDPRVESFARLLLDQAVIAEGSKVTDPVGFAKRINELMTASLK